MNVGPTQAIRCQTLGPETATPRSLKISTRSLDALRGALALYVLIGHARWLLWIGHSQWLKGNHSWPAYLVAYSSSLFRYGHEAVMVFFVLSGYFIHRSFAEASAHRTESFSVRRFLNRRARRLAPPYFLALLLTLSLDLCGRHFWPALYLGKTGDVLLDSVFSHAGFSPAAVVPATFMLPGALGLEFGTNGPLWSLGYEVIYYLLYPLWNYVYSRSVVLGYGTGLFAATIAFHFARGSFLGSVLAHYPIWLAGAAFADLSVRNQLGRSFAWIATALGTAPLPLVFLDLSTGFKVILEGLVGIAGFACFCLIPDSWHRRIPHQCLEFIGIRSYSIYILHFPILTLFAAATLSKYGARPETFSLAIGGSIAAISISLLFFNLCERHFVTRRTIPTTVATDSVNIPNA